MSSGVEPLATDHTTELCRLCERVRELEQLTQSLLLLTDHVPATMWVTDCNLRITHSQPFPGWPDRTGELISAVIGVDHTGVESHRRALKGDVIASEDSYGGLELSARIGPLRNSLGEIVGTIGVAVNVTQQRMLERRMAEAQRAESLGVLAGGLAHDINNLLVTILGNAELMALHAPGAAAAPLGQLRTAALRAGELTRQLLAYAGTQTLATRPHDLVGVVREMVHLMSVQWPSDIGLTLLADAPAIFAQVEDAGVRQVVMNLLSNARDAMAGRTGDVVVRLGTCEVEGLTKDDVVPITAGHYVSIQVSDAGPGVPDTLRGRIFDPFFSTKTTGRGLGLAASIGILRSHRGGLRLRSDPARGAVFETLWPVAPGPQALPLPPTTRVAEGRSVLVVDDDPLVRGVIVRLLEELGGSVHQAGSAEDALVWLNTRAADVIVLDLNMPGRGGRFMLSELRRLGNQTPVIVCSGNDLDLAGLDASGRLPKPFSKDDLESVLGTVLTGVAR